MTTHTQVAPALAQLADFTPAEAQAIAARGTIVTVPAQWAPMAQGTPADKVYLILDGRVSIRKNKQPVAELTAGDIVGELAFSRKSLRTATVVTETPTTVLHFTAQEWKRLLADQPKLAQAVERVTSARN